ncbi:MAG TPA: uracil-DNA glycosylase [Candidatus Saccharimonadales bacterium]|jgi:DNA polymerase|nr:uracil-DNA glycosylase [Candidatus Saccharimonadales bacterium]
MKAQTKQNKLDKIRADILKKNICPDLASSATNLVFGDGSADAEIVFIGEAPGKNEDLQGKPFVGAAGKFLDELLESINLRRKQVYITNIVKYRPPQNRDPLPDEKAAFLPFLEQQLEIIGPLLVVTLGRHSLNCFLPELQISSCHGQPKRYKGTVYLPLFHPAAALYNSGLKQTLIDDFGKIPAIIKLIKES